MFTCEMKNLVKEFEMKKKFFSITLSLLVIILLCIGTYKLMNSRTYQVLGRITDHVNTNEKVVALTFDDGPTTNVEEILPLLEKYNAKATFFVIGNELEKNIELGQEIANAGHQIGNHTYSHKRMIFKKPSYIKQEVEKTNELIRQTGYTGQIDFRPPNGKKLFALPFYLNKQNIETITWDIEPDTYFSTVSEKVDYVKSHVKSGSIILLHPMYDQTENELKALEGILKALNEQGYHFLTVNELQEL
jgi:peptidoglycan-N-acetylglucosamine deacetylase